MPARVSSGNFYQQQRNMTRNVGGHRPIHHNSYQQQQQQHPHQQQQLSKNQAIREAHRKEKKNLDSYLADDENFPSFKLQLERMGLQLRDIPADGNCLFRALGDQMEGHCRNHFKHRSDVVNFMRHHRPDFEPFVEDDVSFDDHVRNLERLGTHAGNDAIVAFAKFHQVDVIIHQLNGEPLMIQGPQSSNKASTRQLHIAYHNGDHYSSVRTLDDNTESPANIRWHQSRVDKAPPTPTPLGSSGDSGGGVVSVRRGLEDIETEVMLATQCMDIARVRDTLIDYNYDVEASIADLLQQMELTGEATLDDSTSLASHQTVDSGVDGTQSSSGPSSPTGPGGSALKHTNGGSVNGKGHKVHFREDSFGGNSSGYGSVSSQHREGGARPKLVPSQRKLKETKKMEKKRRAEERHRQKLLGGGVGAQPVPQGYDGRGGMVMENGRPQHVHAYTLQGGRLTSI